MRMQITSPESAGGLGWGSGELLRCTPPPLRVPALLLLASFAIPHPAFDEAPATEAFLEQHCYECHNGESKKGGLDLTELAFQPDDSRNFAQWMKLFDRASVGEMPPKQRARPA